MGAIDFIKSGDSDANKAMLLNPLSIESGNMELDESAPKAIPKLPEMDESLKKIEKCCVEWRAGKVKPHWVTFNDFKNKKSTDSFFPMLHSFTNITQNTVWLCGSH